MDQPEKLILPRDFPPELKEIPGPPRELYAKGNLNVLKHKKIALVGSRDASTVARQKATELTKLAVADGWVTISGLARGIDTIIHEVTLSAGGQTIAVLAHGLDQIYPPENLDLAQKIVKAGGLLLSEHPSGTPIRKDLFLARNRIVVGLAKCLVVVEAQLRSGSLASATHAAEQGRDVLAVPGSSGCELLIEEGAIPIPNNSEFQAILASLT